MEKAERLMGQWVGHFSYGPAYGEEICDEKVEFRLFINSCNHNEFTGKCITLEGIGANYEVADIQGFVDRKFISFTKQYPKFYQIDEVGNTITKDQQPHPAVSYHGQFDNYTGIFSGTWELSIDIEPAGEGWLEHVCTGNWEMKKDEEMV